MKSYIEQSIEFDKKRLNTYLKQAGAPSKAKLTSHFDKRYGVRNYYLQPSPNAKTRYVGKDELPVVFALQEKAFANKMIEALQHNIKLKRSCAKALIPDDEQSVLASMSITYRPVHQDDTTTGTSTLQSENPYRRESLTLATSFGLMVRSKGELAIAELLHSLGIKFFYEKKLSIKSSEHSGFVTYYPDFTIVLPDGRFIYWEHQGLLYSRDYVQSNLRKIMDYNYNGIYESHNLIVTADGPENSIDLEGIKRIITGWIIPMM